LGTPITPSFQHSNIPTSFVVNAGHCDGNNLYVENRLEGCAPLTIAGIVA